jgi:uncharacterized membrane protein YjgN (DUF898 family)
MRKLAILALVGFLVFTGTYVFVYLFRAFRLSEPIGETTVHIWHGDPMMRALLVAVLFLIGLVLLMFMSIVVNTARRSGSVRLRSDLWEWLDRQGEQTNETADRVAERAVARYREEIDHSR